MVAVSDGHGGLRYVRSEVGARTRCRGRYPAPCGERLATETSYDPQLLQVDGARASWTAWRAAVLAHARGAPVHRRRRRRSPAIPLDGNPLVAYGATLLVALVE